MQDSVSLVCSADGSFCGPKELVLTDPNGNIIDMSTSSAFNYDSVTNKLTITPLNIGLVGTYTLQARLSQYSTTPMFYPVKAEIKVLESYCNTVELIDLEPMVEIDGL